MRTPKAKLFYKQSRWRNHVRKQVLHDFGYRCVQCNVDLSNAGKHAQVHHEHHSCRHSAARFILFRTTRGLIAGFGEGWRPSVPSPARTPACRGSLPYRVVEVG
jgi:hypothetical protein